MVSIDRRLAIRFEMCKNNKKNIECIIYLEFKACKKVAESQKAFSFLSHLQKMHDNTVNLWKIDKQSSVANWCWKKIIAQEKITQISNVPSTYYDYSG